MDEKACPYKGNVNVIKQAGKEINSVILTWRSDAQHTAAVQSENTGRVEPGVVWARLGAQHLRYNLNKKLK